MHKLRLELDELQVESFDVESTPRRERGTIHGAQEFQRPPDDTYDYCTIETGALLCSSLPPTPYVECTGGVGSGCGNTYYC
jgi:hypothetical protein